jgi:hypothetical protein
MACEIYIWSSISILEMKHKSPNFDMWAVLIPHATFFPKINQQFSKIRKPKSLYQPAVDWRQQMVILVSSDPLFVSFSRTLLRVYFLVRNFQLTVEVVQVQQPIAGQTTLYGRVTTPIAGGVIVWLGTGLGMEFFYWIESSLMCIFQTFSVTKRSLTGCLVRKRNTQEQQEPGTYLNR